MRVPYKWGSRDHPRIPPVNWSSNPYTWSDVAFILKYGNSEGLEYIRRDPEVKKRFIKLLCKVQGKEYVETKEIEKVEIFIKDLELVAKEVAGINLKIEI